MKRSFVLERQVISMIEVKKCDNVCFLEDAIITSFDSDFIRLDKSYKLSRKERKSLLSAFSLYKLDDVSQGFANENLLRVLQGIAPSPRRNFRRWRQFCQTLYDIKQILLTDNLEFNLVCYLSRVYGLSFKELASCEEVSDERCLASV